MAKLVYLGGGSTSHPVKKLYIGVNGVSKKIKRGYIGDANGKARLFYNSAYQWQRYTIGTSYSLSSAYTVKFPIANPQSFYHYVEVRKYKAVTNADILSSGIFREPDATDIVDGVQGTTSIIVDYKTYPWFNVRWVERNTQEKDGYAFGSDSILLQSVWYSATYGAQGSRITQNPRGYIMIIRNDNINVGTTEMPGITINSTQTKGTYVDTVENENPSAYPDNGISGNYWYVKIS